MTWALFAQNVQRPFSLSEVIVRFAARAAMAVLLLLGVYVLAIGLVAGLGFAVYEGFTHGFAGFVVGKGLIVTLLLALALGRAFWAARGLRGDPTGLLLTPEEQPQLWNEVRELAGTIGTRPPDEIRLEPLVNASVQENSRCLGLIGGRRVLTIGVPLLLGLTRQQLRSVLAHELGHYSHRHTALTPIAYRGQVTLGHIVSRLGHDSWTGRMFAAYGRVYLRLTLSVTRRQEVEADEWSYRIAGRAASAGAMREIPALDGIWNYFLEEYAFRVKDVRPDDLFLGYANLLASPQRQREMDVLRHDLPEEPQSPYDTHPSLAVRVRYFESLPDDGLVDDNASAIELLVNEDEVLRRLEAEMFEGAPLEPRPWQWIVETAGVQRARENASLLVRATSDVGSGAETLRQAISSLGRNGGHNLVRPYLATDAPPAQVTTAARELVRAAVSAALVEHCGARFTLDWDAPDALIGADGHRIDVAALVEGTTTREAADDLIRALAAEGVPLSFSVEPTEGETLAKVGWRYGEPALESVAACVRRRRTQVLVLAENALILKRLGPIERVLAGFRQRNLDGYRNATMHVASIPLPRLLKDPRAEVFAWSQVGPAHVSGTRLTLTLDGRRHRLQVKPQAIAGDLLGSLRRHLGERLAA